jgi:hypothetical protein
MYWVNWGEHGKLLHFQFLIYVALATQTISICIRRHFLSRRECMDWTIQQFIMLGWNCLIITSILWTKYCKLYQTTNATLKTPCARGKLHVLEVEVSHKTPFGGIHDLSHVPVGVTSNTYCNHKYCTFTITFSLTYILLVTSVQELFTYPVSYLWDLNDITDYSLHSTNFRIILLEFFGNPIISKHI